MSGLFERAESMPELSKNSSSYTVKPAISELRGLLRRPGQPSVSVEEMQEAIEITVAENYGSNGERRK
jgi:hypothetical protein